MYEAAFSTQGSHPMGGVAMARTLEEARQQLANVLIFADPTAPATRRSSPSTAAYPWRATTGPPGTSSRKG